jgi:hypothetical protein
MQKARICDAPRPPLQRLPDQMAQPPLKAASLTFDGAVAMLHGGPASVGLPRLRSSAVRSAAVTTTDKHRDPNGHPAHTTSDAPMPKRDQPAAMARIIVAACNRDATEHPSCIHPGLHPRLSCHSLPWRRQPANCHPPAPTPRTLHIVRTGRVYRCPSMRARASSVGHQHSDASSQFLSANST